MLIFKTIESVRLVMQLCSLVKKTQCFKMLNNYGNIKFLQINNFSQVLLTLSLFSPLLKVAFKVI